MRFSFLPFGALNFYVSDINTVIQAFLWFICPDPYVLLFILRAFLVNSILLAFFFLFYLLSSFLKKISSFLVSVKLIMFSFKTFFPSFSCEFMYFISLILVVSLNCY